MPKQENTAINDLIGFTYRKPIDDIDEPVLFSSPPPAANLRPVPFGASLSPIGATVAPLPRRRAPMSTPSQVPMSADYADDAATRVDPPAISSRPPQQQFAAPAARPAYPAPHQPPAYYQAPYPDHLETMRVGAMPLDSRPTLGGDVVAWIAKLWIPFAALGVIAMAFAGYRFLGGDGENAAAAPVTVEAPIVMAAPPPEPPPAIVEPIVEPVAAEVPKDSLWQPTKPQPTLVAPSEAVDSEPASTVEPTTKRSDRSAIRRAAKRAAAKRMAAKREKRVAVAEIRAEKSKPEKTVAIAAAKPMKIGATTAAKGTGAGKLSVASTPPTLIYVDGRNTGMMTPKTLSLPEGNHKITLLSPKDKIAKTISVEIAAGSSGKLTRDFTK